jgi:hypothetical protein
VIMPKFKVENQSKHSIEDTFKRIRHLLENDKDLKRMDATYVCKFDEKSFSGSAKGSKFEANLKIVSMGTTAHVEIEVSLPMLLTPVKGVVQNTLQKKLDAALV